MVHHWSSGKSLWAVAQLSVKESQTSVFKSGDKESRIRNTRDRTGPENVATARRTDRKRST